MKRTGSRDESLDDSSRAFGFSHLKDTSQRRGQGDALGTPWQLPECLSVLAVSQKQDLRDTDDTGALSGLAGCRGPCKGPGFFRIMGAE
jgi:hypothetical protein